MLYSYSDSEAARETTVQLSGKKKMPPGKRCCLSKGKFMDNFKPSTVNSLFVFQWLLRGYSAQSAYQLSSGSSEPVLHGVPGENGVPTSAAAVPKDCQEENKRPFHLLMRMHQIKKRDRILF
ncbi:hypothetical protein PoB_002272600 [Plakobranchus ocellatus]|uniref:Uncharacterized protein n=1 Tax=Plakobranchus ocellatus TaxID=259542 RepID=A0AAV3ZNX2_9GAST|nr:hypothetical protein PoB_002272600 [Plakobranchus ocellatus]